MKKKIIILSSALTAILSAGTVFAGGPEIIPVIPDYFTGLFIGPVGGVTQTLFDVNGSTNVDPTTVTVLNDSVVGVGTFTTQPSYSDISANGGTFDGFVGVEGGLGITVAHQYYLGVVGFGEWGKSTSTEQNSSTSGGNYAFQQSGITAQEFTDPNSSTTLKQTITTEFENKYGVYFKPGWLVSPTTMVFGEIGGIWATVEATNNVAYNVNAHVSDIDTAGGVTTVGDVNTITGSASGSSSTGDKTKTALLLGAGFETFVLPQWFGTHLTVGADYKYANFGTVTTTTNFSGNLNRSYRDPDASAPDANNTINGTTSASASVKISEFNGFAHFYFGNSFF